MAFPAGGGFGVDISSSSGSGSGISPRDTYDEKKVPFWATILFICIQAWILIYIVVCFEVAMKELYKLPGGCRVTYGKVYRRALSLATGFALVAWIFRRRPAEKEAIATNPDIESARRNRELSSPPEARL
ncbi:hypothetical protein B0T11DRAFT_330273 [Plectosphaerella cucumerina]|uniref:Uncharacterized protein n=1 Tax=Plectosphaerella cucumerina TaxID=40658 RepID=A0A8K0TBD7_9PEZI|nr:hypothetical protein B0T11DRAFT_330273 [Plectosphaerella cucumerina]